MKFVQAPDLDLTADTDKEAMGWSLSWQPDGRCDSFTREAIIACAPQTSGVYGLFNFDCQIFIGESANIQEVLLRLENESDFQSPHLRPTGFTFEPCAPELRRVKAVELIARFHPVLQTEDGLTETRPPSNSRTVTGARQRDQALKTDVDQHEFPPHVEKGSQARWSFQFKRTQYIAVTTALIASAAVTFYLFKLADSTQEQVNVAAEKSPARISMRQSSASGQDGIGSRARNVSSIDAVGGLASQKTKPTPRAKPDIDPNASTPDNPARFGATKTSAADEESVQRLLVPAKKIPTADSSGSVSLSKRWSVQISASPAKDIADKLVQRLVAKGYSSYVVPAEVKGQTYYRVRVGHFAEREEAESMRQSLTSQEGYRDAYLTGD